MKEAWGASPDRFFTFAFIILPKRATTPAEDSTRNNRILYRPACGIGLVGLQTWPEKCSRWFLVTAVIVAPWVAGATSRSTTGLWILATLLILAFLSELPQIMGELVRRIAFRWLLAGCAVILGCLAFWAWTGPVAYVSEFTERQTAILAERMPALLLPMSHTERWLSFATAILGLLTTAVMARDYAMRRTIVLAAGISGSLVLLYGLAMKLTAC